MRVAGNQEQARGVLVEPVHDAWALGVFKLLKFFATHLDRVYSRDQLLDSVWGDDAYVEPRTVDVHIRRLREKIEPEGKLIKTVRGTGYRFSPDKEGEEF